jgi:hypothetical protein
MVPSPCSVNRFVGMEAGHDGFLQRWLLLEPINQPNRTNTVFTDTYVRNAMNTEYNEGNFITDGIKIHYHRSGGKKPPIVLLHGATDDGLCWERKLKCARSCWPNSGNDATNFTNQIREIRGFCF